ncbi:cell wall-binding repeat-containing protein [Catenulispora sp. GAS73]|uniref:cell wall-binding repeat-containing protein n=1 Tax=Catenulispora sp. GAS73 TaxID=3156269 RepID=UPI003514E816
MATTVPAHSGSGSAKSVAADSSATLNFAPYTQFANGGQYDFYVSFAGRGCMGVAACVDPSVPATATWSLDYQDTAPGSTPVHVTSGSGNSIASNARTLVEFPTPAAGAKGAWRISITFTDTTGGSTRTWSNYVLMDYGNSGIAPGGPSGLDAGTADYGVAVGTPITITATGGYVAPGSSKHQEIFDFGDPGGTNSVQTVDVPAAPAGTQPTTTATYTYSKPGTYYVLVSTFDGVNQSPPYAMAVTVTADSANLVVSPTTGVASVEKPLVVTLDGTGSKAAPGATITKYAFSCQVLMGSGTCGSPTPVPVPGQPGKATVTFDQVGAAQIGLTVTDSDGNVAQAPFQTINYGQGPSGPGLGTFGFAVGPAPLTASADLRQIKIDPSADPASTKYTITWGDGQTSTYTGATLPPGPATHTYAAAGRYNASLRVDDGLGLSGSVQTMSQVLDIAPVPPAPPGPTQVIRLAGQDRFDTGVHVSRFAWADAGDTAAGAGAHPDAVVLATGRAFPDALAGVPLASKVNGDLLLTDPATLTPEVRDEIRRVLPADGRHTVYALGGTAAISPGIVKELTSLGYHVDRLGGTDRFATSLLIAHTIGDPSHVVVARGDDFADALSAGPLAADLFGTGSGTSYTPAAIVLTNGPTLDPATKSYIQKRLTSHDLSVVAVGGDAAKAIAPLPGLVGTGPNPNAIAIFGANRYETAADVASVFTHVDPRTPLGIATGTSFADALTGGAFMALTGGPLLLTDPSTESSATRDAVLAEGPSASAVLVFGGPGAVSPAIFNQLITQVGGVGHVF